MPSLAVIGAPSSAGAYAPGQELAPGALREAGLLRLIEDGGGVVNDRGDTTLRRWSPDHASRRAQNVAAVEATIAEVSKAVATSMVDGELPLVLGGDCTVGIGAVRALTAATAAAGLVYLDLHADMNTPDTTIDGALDWMGVAHMLGLPGSVEQLSQPPLLLPGQVSLLGLDDSQATAAERERVAQLAVPVTPVTALAADPAAAARAALALLPQCQRLAVHFDVDVIDFVEAPLSENTGRNVGVRLDTALAALAELLADARVAVVTVTELNPLHGAADGSTVAEFARGVAAGLAPRSGA